MQIINLSFIVIALWLSLLTSTIEAQWIQTNGHFGRFYLMIQLAVRGENIFASTAGLGVFKSTNNGASWIQINNGLKSLNIRSIIVKEQNIFVGTLDSGIFISTNNGALWRQTNVGLTDTRILSFAVNDQYIFVGTWSGGIFASSDNGSIWNHFGIYGHYRALAASDTNIFAGSLWEIHPQQGGHVYYSSNSGANWRLVSNGIPDEIVEALAITEEHVFVAFNDYYGIYKSSNHGDTWFPANSGLPGRLPRSLISYKSGDDEYLFVGNLNEPDPTAEAKVVYLSTDEGMNWINISEGLSNSAVWSFAINDQYLFAGADSTVWRRPLPDLITLIDGQTDKPPVYYSLGQNYPNPFNPSTKISYSIPKVSFVSLKVYDLLGKEIATLVNEEKQIGNHEIEFNGRNLSSGVYFYKIQAGSFSDTKKFLLLK